MECKRRRLWKIKVRAFVVRCARAAGLFALRLFGSSLRDCLWQVLQSLTQKIIYGENFMKKLILTLLIGGFIMTGLSAKTAFVYFSATGTTERMAKNSLLYVPAVEAVLVAAEVTLQNLLKARTLKAEKILPVEVAQMLRNILKVC